MNKEIKLAIKAWEIIYPVAMYYVTIVVSMFCAQMIFGSGNETYMLCKTIGSVVTIFVVWSFYKRELLMDGRYKLPLKINMAQWVNVVMVILMAICLSISLNNFIVMSPLMSISEAYQDAADAFYGSNIWLELLGSALVTPVLEELLHRGVVYSRLRRMMGMWGSVLVSALVFASLHFNVVQFTYAFLIGIVLAIIMEKTKHIYAPILFHIIANFIAVLRTETGILDATVDKSVMAWLVSAILFIFGIVLLFVYSKKFFMKRQA